MQRTNTWATPMHCKPGTKKKTSHPTVVASQGSSATHEVHILKGNRSGEKKTWDIYGLIEMNNEGI